MTFNFSSTIIETPEQCVENMFKVKNKDTKRAHKLVLITRRHNKSRKTNSKNAFFVYSVRNNNYTFATNIILMDIFTFNPDY